MSHRNNDFQFVPHLSAQEIIDFACAPDPIDDNSIIDVEGNRVQFNGYRAVHTTKEEWRRLQLICSENPPAPVGLTKSEYNSLIKSNKESIERRKILIREAKNKLDDRSADFLQTGLDSMIAYEKNLKARVTTLGKTFDGSRLIAAKRIPIDSLIEVRNGFARCPLHTDKTPSVKVYKEQNKWHCFSCGAHGDSVDIIMAINGIGTAEAIKVLVGA